MEIGIPRKGGYSDLNRELTVPHTVVLPIELHPPLLIIILYTIYKVSRTVRNWNI